MSSGFNSFKKYCKIFLITVCFFQYVREEIFFSMKHLKSQNTKKEFKETSSWMTGHGKKTTIMSVQYR